MINKDLISLTKQTNKVFNPTIKKKKRHVKKRNQKVQKHGRETMKTDLMFMASKCLGKRGLDRRGAPSLGTMNERKESSEATKVKGQDRVPQHL